MYTFMCVCMYVCMHVCMYVCIAMIAPNFVPLISACSSSLWKLVHNPCNLYYYLSCNKLHRLECEQGSPRDKHTCSPSHPLVAKAVQTSAASGMSHLFQYIPNPLLLHHGRRAGDYIKDLEYDSQWENRVTMLKGRTVTGCLSNRVTMLKHRNVTGCLSNRVTMLKHRNVTGCLPNRVTLLKHRNVILSNRVAMLKH